jgi:DNA-binding MurR/RpiR family transcriptional regulator
MTGPLIRLSDINKGLTRSEKKVADYITKNPDKIPLISVLKLAERTGVSVASVSRLAKKIGYSNFQEMKVNIAQDLSSDLGEIYQSISPQDSDKEVIEKAFLGNIKSLEDTLRIIKHKELITAAKKIANCNRIVFFGIGSSGHIASDAALRFSLLDLQADAYSDPQQILLQALRLQKSDVAVALSHSGRSKITIEALQLAGKSGVKTIGISNYIDSPLHKISNIFLCTAFSENRVKVAALSSRIAQMCYVDVLYLLVARFKRKLKKADLVNKYSEKILRTPAK